MEKEKINENTMRVILTKEDLAERDISIIDLIGNQKDVEEFFYGILDEVDTEHEFRNHGAVTFQLVPSGDGVELFITKVDPEEAEKYNLPGDAKFDDNNSVMLSNVTADDLDKMGLDKDVANILKNKLHDPEKLSSALSEHANNILKNNSDNSQGNNEDIDPHFPVRIMRVVEFKTFDDVIGAVSNLNLTVEFNSSLFEENGKFYMTIAFTDNFITEGTVSDVMAGFSEFGQIVNVAPAVIAEHGKLIKSEKAFEWLKYYFS